jgi:hypothetical protein
MEWYEGSSLTEHTLRAYSPSLLTILTVLTILIIPTMGTMLTILIISSSPPPPLSNAWRKTRMRGLRRYCAINRLSPPIRGPRRYCAINRLKVRPKEDSTNTFYQYIFANTHYLLLNTHYLLLKVRKAPKITDRSAKLVNRMKQTAFVEVLHALYSYCMHHAPHTMLTTHRTHYTPYSLHTVLTAHRTHCPLLSCRYSRR